MKPHVILHMGSSLDGRIVPTHWPQDLTDRLTEVYERVHQALESDAWIVGRITMASFQTGSPKPAMATEALPRTTWKASAAAQGPYAIAIDQHGKLHLNRGQISGDAIIVVLSEAVSDDHLAELRRDGISYIFAGRTEIDLARALTILATEFGIKRLLLEGGGAINGSFLSAGLIDEISLIVVPLADGLAGLPTTFDRTSGKPRLLQFQSVEQLEHDLVHLRYTVV
ncbi:MULTISPECIES: RibD family protein [unclassified Beijerinckia]|uniref:dihydrofolate reductase family protein n=1 Tax=unclassified Beijerinckia TaxID=2638183 RepID=UPI00089A2469|nr:MULTISPECIES: RibD family protein [unclassified Beijerinckia]MDH7795094.1 riboflavin biosynthesis pyrimidine reductase [Beijerinckia sp. GAS462]SEB87320.1 Pyrimidine reductase, riboflavin biosynthesis [Beijerinckia sp. 28-YEA-48]